MKSVAFYTLGCKLNFSETSTISRQFLDAGFQKKNFEDGADVYLINTCSVTENADNKCRKVVQQALKHNASAYIIIVGCYAQLKPDEIAQIPGVDLVLGANEKFNVLEFADFVKKEKADVKFKKINETKYYVPSYSIADRTRTFLKVQDGCDYFCSFCTIPLARGRSRNDSIANTVKLAEELAEKNVKEIVLTGVNIGDFGKSTGESFFDLVQQLDRVEGIERFRISSIEPNLLTNEIIDFVADSKKFVPHFHIPLQSGSDEVLKLMRRRYDTALYTDRVSRIRKKMPDACIGVDVITGTRGETEELFLETYHYLNQLDISYLHVFTYSERANTTALRHNFNVPYAERKKRTAMLRILSEKKRNAFYQKHLGEKRLVLLEEENNSKFMYGFTDNYVKVRLPYDPLFVNEVREVKLKEINEEGTVNASLTLVEEIPDKLKNKTLATS